MFWHRSVLRLLRLLTAAALLTSCGTAPSAEPEAQDDGSESSTTGSVAANSIRSNPKKKIPLQFDISFGANLTISTATAFSISLTDCVSGYSATVTEANTDGLEAYLFDKGCKVKLLSFTWEGRNYIPTVADPFTTWQTGDVAVFDEAGAPGTYAVQMVVVSTLSDPINALDVVKFGIARISQGGSKSLVYTTASSGLKLPDLDPNAPSFTVRRITLVDLDLATEAGKFRFYLECTSDITITNTCAGINLDQLDIKLVQDTYSSVLTGADADTIFTTAGASVVLPDHRISPGDQGLANGGITTVTFTAPGPLATTPNLILIIRASQSSYYQYFNVDTTLSSP